MANDKSAADEFLNGVEAGDDFAQEADPFKTEETPEENSVEDVAEVDEKPLPFHKDPKVQRYVEKQIAKALEGRPVEKEFAREKGESVDDYYERLIGNDTPEKVAMIREAKARDERLLEQAEERAFNRLTKQRQEEAQANREAEEELETAFDNIEETYNVDITSNNPVARKTRQDFINFVERIAPKDRNGDIVDYPDMISAFETFQDMRKTQPSTRAKELANRSVARSSEVSSKPQERVTFDSVDGLFERMLGK